MMFKSLLFCFTLVVGGAGASSGYAQVQPSEVKISPLQRIELPDGKMAAILTLLEGRPNVETPRHSHPGVEVGYVLEGAVDFKFGETGPQTFQQGESYVIPFNMPHMARFGPNGAKLLNTFAVEKNKPLVNPMP